MIRRPTISTLFPYTTLFRSSTRGKMKEARSHLSTCRWKPRRCRVKHDLAFAVQAHGRPRIQQKRRRVAAASKPAPCMDQERRRSEEHTSELQSQFHLVCRLL